MPSDPKFYTTNTADLIDLVKEATEELCHRAGYLAAALATAKEKYAKARRSTCPEVQVRWFRTTDGVSVAATSAALGAAHYQCSEYGATPVGLDPSTLQPAEAPPTAAFVGAALADLGWSAVW